VECLCQPRRPPAAQIMASQLTSPALHKSCCAPCPPPAPPPRSLPTPPPCAHILHAPAGSPALAAAALTLQAHPVMHQPWSQPVGGGRGIHHTQRAAAGAAVAVAVAQPTSRRCDDVCTHVAAAHTTACGCRRHPHRPHHPHCCWSRHRLRHHCPCSHRRRRHHRQDHCPHCPARRRCHRYDSRPRPHSRLWARLPRPACRWWCRCRRGWCPRCPRQGGLQRRPTGLAQRISAACAPASRQLHCAWAAALSWRMCGAATLDVRGWVQEAWQDSRSGDGPNAGARPPQGAHRATLATCIITASLQGVTRAVIHGRGGVGIGDVGAVDGGAV